MLVPFPNACAVYALAFTCNVRPCDARYSLKLAGRADGDGSTDRQILRAVKELSCRARRFHSDAKTFRTFARECHEGAFLVTSTDHAAAVVDGNICQRPYPRNSDLYRIEKIWKITLDWS